MRNDIRLLLCGTVVLGGLAAQDASTITGPSMGMVYDAARSALRPIRGIPGAATLGDALPLEFAPSRAWISPSSNFALLERGEDLQLMLVQRSGDALVPSVLSDAPAGPDSVTFAADGSSAALSYGSEMLVYTGLPGKPALRRRIPTSGLPGKPRRVGVSAGGAAVLASVREGDASSLYAAADDSFQRIGGYGDITSIRFTGSGSDALVADGAANAVYLIRDAAGAAESSLLVSEREGLQHPVDLAISSRGQILVANEGSKKITYLERIGGSVTELECGCELSGLTALAGAATFRLTEPSDASLWIVDLAASEARILAVPQALSQTAGGAQ